MEAVELADCTSDDESKYDLLFAYSMEYPFSPDTPGTSSQSIIIVPSSDPATAVRFIGAAGTVLTSENAPQILSPPLILFMA